MVRALPCHGRGHGFESHSGRFRIVEYADVAQLAEQLICNQQVIGSSPIIGFVGGIPEWPKGADCKSVSIAFSGSNPLSPIKCLNNLSICCII